MTILVPAIVAVLAAIVYVLTAGRQPKVAEIARLTFLSAALVLMYVLAGERVRVGGAP